MILILTEHKDISANKVVEWLNYFEGDYLRINTLDHFKKCFFEISFFENKNEIKLAINNEKIGIKDFEVVWFRRGYLNINSNYLLNELDDSEKRRISQHLKEEEETLLDYIYDKLKDTKSYNHPKMYNINKLIVLNKAQECGLKIPKTIISTMPSFIKENEEEDNYITKSIQDTLIVNSDCIGTKIINKEHISKLNRFYYSLFQEFIESKYELRVFIFGDLIYCCAIFRTKMKSSADIREYDVNEGHSRVIPFILSKSIKSRLFRLLNKLNLESGSIDILVDKKNDYYFLEVNPVGQFDYVSKLCNYYIERDIAKILKNEK